MREDLFDDNLLPEDDESLRAEIAYYERTGRIVPYAVDPLGVRTGVTADDCTSTRVAKGKGIRRTYSDAQMAVIQRILARSKPVDHGT